MSALLEVDGLEAGYGPLTVLRGVSFAVEQGQVVTILGPNGAGKTTTLRALSGMVRPRGRIVFGGKSVAGRRPERIARKGIAHVPEGRGTFPGMTVEENLRVGAYARRDGGAVASDLATSPCSASAAGSPQGASAAASSRCWRWRGP